MTAAPTTNTELAARARAVADQAHLAYRAALCCGTILTTTGTPTAARKALTDLHLAADVREGALQLLDEFTAEPELYPALIGVSCDGCGVAVQHDYLVSDDDDTETRLEFARAALRPEGWTCDQTGDRCPACAPARGESL